MTSKITSDILKSYLICPTIPIPDRERDVMKGEDVRQLLKYGRKCGTIE